MAFMPRAAHVLQWRGTKGGERASGSKSQKTRPSSDRRLQLAFVKSESLVIAGQQHRGECVPEPCTHRPSSHERSGRPKSLCQPQGGRRRRRNGRLGLSRNKVTVGEPAVGSPPF